MYTTRLLQLLLAVVALLCVAHAYAVDASPDHRALMQRQDDAETSGATVADPEPTADPVPSTTAEPTEQTTEEPTADPTTSEPPVEETTTAAEQTSAPPPAETTTSQSDPEPTTEAAQTTSAPAPEQTESTTSAADDSEPSTTSPAETSSSSKNTDKQSTTTHSISVATSVAVVTKTNGDGEKETMTTTSRTTHTASLNDDDSSDGDGGLSPKTRNTVIGVVVGVGGAIVIGALAIVAWRIWGRKKNTEESDTLMTDYSPAGQEKVAPDSSAGGSTVGAQRSPFQTTLENYHQPAPVNASSNF